MICIGFLIVQNLFSQSRIATVNAGSHLIKTTDWSEFKTANILVTKLDGSKSHIYTYNTVRATNPNAMNVDGLEDDFEQGSEVKVYILKPKASGFKSKPILAKVNGGSHLMKTTDWSIYNNKTILVEEINGLNQNVYSYSSARPINANAMYVDGISADFEQNTDVHVYIIETFNFANGNVGIGTTTPSAKLEILRDANLTSSISLPSSALVLRADNDGSDATLRFGVDNTNLKAVIQTQQTSTGSKFDLLLNPFGGNVGIGTTNPGTWKLAVNGNIRAKEIKVETGWSDFVFYDDYKLPTLQEVENHIKEKGHLKDIPSAKDVEENGVFLGEMDSKLLQKIEELTLYTIQQEKTLEKQSKEIQNLKLLNQKFLELQLRLDKLENKN